MEYPPNSESWANPINGIIQKISLICFRFQKVYAVMPMAARKEMTVKLIIEKQLADFDRHDHAERLKIAKRKGAAGNPLFIVFNNPSIEFTLDELKVLVPLERDRVNYLKLAENAHGLLSIPKQKGRLHPHMSKRKQTLKCESLRGQTARAA